MRPAQHVLLWAYFVVVIAIAAKLARGLFPTDPGAAQPPETTDEIIDEWFVAQYADTNTTGFEAYVGEICESLEGRLAAGAVGTLRRTMHAIIEEDAEEMFEEWRRQGRAPVAEGWIGETGTVQEMHLRRRVSLLGAAIDTDGVRIIDPDVDPLTKTDFEQAKTRIRDDELELLDTHSLRECESHEILIPGVFPGVDGTYNRGVYGVTLIRAPDGPWVMRAISYYSDSIYEVLLPIF